MAVPPFPGLPPLLSANLEARRRLQELQPNGAAEMEAGGVAPPAHGGVWLWPWGSQWQQQIPAAGKGWAGGRLGTQKVPGLVDGTVLARARGGRGAGGGTGLEVVKEAVKRSLLGAGVAGTAGWRCRNPHGHGRGAR